MKRTILLLFCMAGFAFTTQAQNISKNAIGLRFGGGNGYGAEISYQRLVSGNNRLEFDLGFRNDDDYYHSFKLTGLYQWIWNIEGGFNWYVGVGGGVGSVNVDHHHYHNDGAFAFIAGDIGIEYDFNIPLQIALDFRPELFFTNYDYYDDFGPDLALAIRYRF